MEQLTHIVKIFSNYCAAVFLKTLPLWSDEIMEPEGSSNASRQMLHFPWTVLGPCGP